MRSHSVTEFSIISNCSYSPPALLLPIIVRRSRCVGVSSGSVRRFPLCEEVPFNHVSEATTRNSEFYQQLRMDDAVGSSIQVGGVSVFTFFQECNVITKIIKFFVVYSFPFISAIKNPYLSLRRATPKPSSRTGKQDPVSRSP